MMMPTYILIISIVFTIAVLVLSILTISKGYGYKHTIDPPVKNENEDIKEEQGTNR